MAVQHYILLVEHNPDDAGLTTALLKAVANDSIPDVCWVQSVAQALQRLDSKPGCAAVLLDLGLPDNPGLDGLAAIKARAPDVPIIVLSVTDGGDAGLSAVVAGAQDYLVKGSFDSGLLRRALQYAVQRKRVEAALVERLLIDRLTGLPMRRLLIDRLDLAMKRCARDGRSCALLFINLDRFQHIDDTYGHVVGDAVLRGVGARLTRSVRGGDTVARLGGDKFVVLLPDESGLMDSLAVGHKLLDALGEAPPINGIDIEISASIGVVRFRDATEPAELLIQRVDAAMYAAEKQGKVRVRLL